MGFFSCNYHDRSAGKQIEKGKFIEEEKHTPVKGSYDLIVCGAGPAGACAAIQAAREGVRVLLVEVNGCLGGTWTAGLLGWILDWRNKDGMVAEITDRLVRMDATPDFYKFSSHNFPFDIEKFKFLLEEMCRETGKIDVLLHTRVADVAKKDGRLTHIITESKSGREAWEAELFMDCTGDGDLAAISGCEFDMGEPGSGLTQPMTMLAMISGVTYPEIEPFVRRKDDQGSKRKVREEMERAGLDPSIKGPGIYAIRNDLFMVMWNHEYEKSGINTRDVTRATMDARVELHKLVDGLKKRGGPWKNLYLVATPEQIGIRGARRIKGLYTVTEVDLVNGKRHEDAVCRVQFHVDVHSVRHHDDMQRKAYNRGIRSRSYDIPLRSLISKDVNNLMMAGRNISGDFIAHSSYRVGGDAAKLGEEGGKYAARCIMNGELPGEKYHRA